jgi:hypothetical protein
MLYTGPFDASMAKKPVMLFTALSVSHSLDDVALASNAKDNVARPTGKCFAGRSLLVKVHSDRWQMPAKI